MAKMIEIDFHPDERTLRQFGWIALVGFGLLALLAWQEWLVFSFGLGEARLRVAGGLLAVGVLAALLGLVYPRANQPLFVGLALLAFPIGFVLSHVILAVLFFGVIAPIGTLLRLLGHDPMHRRFEPGVRTYWTQAPPSPPRSRYFRQF
jgi:hypothetical protein